MSIIGICVFNSNIEGYVEFIQEEKKDTIININLTNVPQGKHGFHIHEAGDLTENCSSLCAHYNPKNKNHGGPNDKERHVGDLGNIQPNKNGVVKLKMTDKEIKLKGKYSIIGRSVVIHQGEDDLGRGGLDENNKVIDKKKHQDSLKTGNAGKRIACGVIGYSKKMFK